MTFPAIALEGLHARAHRNIFHGVLMTAEAIFLNDAFGLFAGANGNWNIPRCKSVYVLCALPPFFEIVHYNIIMGQMTVHTLRDLFMRRVIPVFVLRVHHMTVRARLWCAAPIRGCVGHEYKEP